MSLADIGKEMFMGIWLYVDIFGGFCYEMNLLFR
jgi:hypothetical protein